MTEVTPPAPDGHRALKSPDISFEFFPPKTEEMEKSLWETIKRLAPLTPNFVSVTYGAGGSTRERTHSTIARIPAETDLTPAAHDLRRRARRDRRDRRPLSRHRRPAISSRCAAIRPAASAPPTHPSRRLPDFGRALAGIKRSMGHRGFGLRLSGKHPESRDFDADIDTLKAKVDAGATRAITQVFFDNDLYFRYLDRVRARGIDIPVVPGIMPMHNFKQARNFVTRAGTTVPSWLADKFEGLDDDAETRKLVAATVAAGQVQKLAKHGVDTFHFYTMNRADLVFAICHLLGIRPQGAQKAA
jgi:methylenetetrahydrofolate reductase (NADPH)